MGVLVSFPCPAPTARAPVDGPSAAILFFTGVRYLRLDEASPYLIEHAALNEHAAAEAAPKKRRRAPRAKRTDVEQFAQA